ncbi:hypothetical protein ACFJI1_02655 [Pseudoxanthomonas sp. UC29_72]
MTQRDRTRLLVEDLRDQPEHEQHRDPDQQHQDDLGKAGVVAVFPQVVGDDRQRGQRRAQPHDHRTGQPLALGDVQQMDLVFDAAVGLAQPVRGLFLQRLAVQLVVRQQQVQALEELAHGSILALNRWPARRRHLCAQHRPVRREVSVRRR